MKHSKEEQIEIIEWMREIRTVDPELHIYCMGVLEKIRRRERKNEYKTIFNLLNLNKFKKHSKSYSDLLNI